MSFAVAPLIKAGISVGGSWLGSKLMGGESSRAKAVAGQQQDIANMATGWGREMQPMGRDMFSLAGRSFNPVVDYWSKILSGNRGVATSMMAPELNRISEGYTATNRATQELMPRGGGRATLMQNLPYMQQRDVSTLMQQARPMAAENLLQAGNATSQAGSALLQNAVNSLYAATAAGRSVLDYENERQRQNIEQGLRIGEGIFNFTKGLPIEEWLKTIGRGRGGSGGGGGAGGVLTPSDTIPTRLPFGG